MMWAEMGEVSRSRDLGQEGFCASLSVGPKVSCWENFLVNRLGRPSLKTQAEDGRDRRQLLENDCLQLGLPPLFIDKGDAQNQGNSKAEKEMLVGVDKKCTYSRQLKEKKMVDILNPSPRSAQGDGG
ncbi:hypothetical protein Ancab_011239 [Ancistrocladus abbreviatus]